VPEVPPDPIRAVERLTDAGRTGRQMETDRQTDPIRAVEPLTDGGKTGRKIGTDRQDSSCMLTNTTELAVVQTRAGGAS
jgi:hypothetical protein